MAQLGGSVYLRRSVEWWWGLRAQEPVLLGDGGRDALAVCHVRWSGGSCSSPVTVVMVSGGGAAVFMLTSTASRVAVLHLCAVSAYHRRRLCSVAVLARCDCAPCFFAGVNHVSRCSAAFGCSFGHSGIRAAPGHVGPLGLSGTVATWWAGSSRAAEQGHWARLPGGAALRGRAGRAEPRARRDLLVPGICRWWSWVWA